MPERDPSTKAIPPILTGMAWTRARLVTYWMDQVKTGPAEKVLE